MLDQVGRGDLPEPVRGRLVAVSREVLEVDRGSAGPVVLAWRVRRLPPVPHSSWLSAGMMVGPLLPPLLTVFRAPVEWDAHAIWWLHAGMFTQGAEYTREVMGNPSMIFTHPDYPPLHSSSVAVVFSLTGPDHLHAAPSSRVTARMAVTRLSPSSRS